MLSLTSSSATYINAIIATTLFISNVHSFTPISSFSSWSRYPTLNRLPSLQLQLQKQKHAPSILSHERRLLRCSCTPQNNEGEGIEFPPPNAVNVKRRSFLCQIIASSSSVPALVAMPPPSQSVGLSLMPNNNNDTSSSSSSSLASRNNKQQQQQQQVVPFHSAAYGREEYTNSIVASRDTNISPKEVYDTISSNFLKEAFDAATKEDGGGDNHGGYSYHVPRALDVGAGAGVSTEVLYNLGYHEIDALDWSGAAWEKYVVEDPSGHCPPGVTFYELDDERYLDQWREKYSASSGGGNGNGTRRQSENGQLLFDVIIFNFGVNENKAALFAKELLNKEHGRLLAPINTSNDYWLKQTYKVMNSKGEVLWDAVDVGAWSVQFQPDVTQDTCSGIWCAPFNGFQKKK